MLNNKVVELPRSQSRDSNTKPTHDVILGGIRKNGKTIVIYLMSGHEYRGKISQFDKYTISIQDDKGNRNTIYKHAIEAFTAED